MKIKFIMVSKDENFLMQRIDFKYAIENNIGTVVEISNNKDSLASVYNKCLDESIEENENLDYIAFMHSDIKFNVESFIKHLEQISGKYDLIGLCGCSTMNISQSPLNWFNSSRLNPETRWGCVTHSELNNQTSFFNSHHPNILDHEVSCIDGLCIVFGKNAISSGMRFDESLAKFDFYDTDISVQAMLTYKLKIGVMVQKDLVHTSVGKSIMKPEFLVNELKFRQKWKFPLTEYLNRFLQQPK